MTTPTRIYTHSSAGTDWAALLLGAGLGLTLALQFTTVRKSDFTSVYASLASFSRLSALVGTYLAIVGIFLVARIPWVERGVGSLNWRVIKSLQLIDMSKIPGKFSPLI